MKRERCWVLGFDAADVLGSWADARIAEAIEWVWREAGSPVHAQAWWMPCSDEYAFRWYINGQLARLLDQADVVWRELIIGLGTVPAEARPYLRDETASGLAASGAQASRSLAISRAG